MACSIPLKAEPEDNPSKVPEVRILKDLDNVSGYSCYQRSVRCPGAPIFDNQESLGNCTVCTIGVIDLTSFPALCYASRTAGSIMICGLQFGLS